VGQFFLGGAAQGSEEQAAFAAESLVEAAAVQAQCADEVVDARS
jgi:hypothetical protein